MRLRVAILTLVVLLTGCASDDPTGTASPPPTPSSTTSTAPAEASPVGEPATSPPTHEISVRSRWIQGEIDELVHVDLVGRVEPVGAETVYAGEAAFGPGPDAREPLTFEITERADHTIEAIGDASETLLPRLLDHSVPVLHPTADPAIGDSLAWPTALLVGETGVSLFWTVTHVADDRLHVVADNEVDDEWSVRGVPHRLTGTARGELAFDREDRFDANGWLEFDGELETGFSTDDGPATQTTPVFRRTEIETRVVAGPAVAPGATEPFEVWVHTSGSEGSGTAVYAGELVAEGDTGEAVVFRGEAGPLGAGPGELEPFEVRLTADGALEPGDGRAAEHLAELVNATVPSRAEPTSRLLLTPDGTLLSVDLDWVVAGAGGTGSSLVTGVTVDETYAVGRNATVTVTGTAQGTFDVDVASPLLVDGEVGFQGTVSIDGRPPEPFVQRWGITGRPSADRAGEQPLEVTVDITRTRPAGDDDVQIVLDGVVTEGDEPTFRGTPTFTGPIDPQLPMPARFEFTRRSDGTVIDGGRALATALPSILEQSVPVLDPDALPAPGGSLEPTHLHIPSVGIGGHSLPLEWEVTAVDGRVVTVAAGGPVDETWATRGAARHRLVGSLGAELQVDVDRPFHLVGSARFEGTYAPYAERPDETEPLVVAWSVDHTAG